MRCPGCKELLLQSQLVKSEVRGFENVDVSYRLSCPLCRTYVGRMFWGRFTPSEATAALMREDGAATVPQQPAPPRGPLQHICPHCGEALPHDIGLLPVLRSPQDRRTGVDRRKAQLPWTGPERRMVQRRQTTDRRAQAAVDQAAAEPDAPADNRQRQDRRRSRQPVLYDRRRGTDRRQSDKRVNREV